MGMLEETLTRYDPRLLATPEGRRIATRLDPLLFAIIYLLPHLQDENGQLTLSTVHEDWIRQAKTWVRPVTVNKGSRKAYIAPRSMGKSTWWQLIFPMWAAAHGHVRFIAAFSASAPQAKQKLRDFKHELDNNLLLRADYPDLCRPARRSTGVSDADRQDMYVAASGFAFSAHGADTKVLGLKVGHLRPDLLILDDIEPDESSYTAYLKQKLLITVQDSILPLNLKARVILVGTVTMPESITHDLVKHAAGRPTEAWVTDEQFQAHHYKPILNGPDGEYSVWPEKWPIDFLQDERATRSFRKNFENDPLGFDGDYWSVDDFQYGTLTACTHTLLSIDPAVTTKRTSDRTGLAVISYHPVSKKAVVLHAEGQRLTGDQIRNRAIALIRLFPQIGHIVLEVNQGHDLWKQVMHDMPVKVVTLSQSASKEVRFADALNHYQHGRVLHAHPMPDLEGEMVSFPKGLHDDVADAVVTGIRRFLTRPNKPQLNLRSVNPR